MSDIFGTFDEGLMGGECEEFILYSECIGGVEYARRIGWLAFGRTGTDTTGSPRRARDLLHWASVHEVAN